MNVRPLSPAILGISLWMLLAATPCPAAAGTPPWVNRGAHAKYPKERYFLGVGSASRTGDDKRDREAAEASARKDILSQIQVSVKSESTAFEEEAHKNGRILDVASFSERTEQSVAGTLEGVTIAELHDEDGTKTRFALAVLDKSAAAAGLKSAIEAANKAVLAAFVKLGSADGDSGLRAMLEAHGIAEKNEASGVLYRALTRETTEVVGTGAVREKVAGYSAKLTLAVEGGDRQPATTGQPLAEPIVFALTAAGKAVPEAPLELKLDGPGKVEARVKTGADGKARVRVSEVTSTGAPEQHVVAKIDWAAWLTDRGSKLSAAAFGVTPLEARAAYLFKTVATTRVGVAIDEKIVWKDASKTEAPKSPVLAPKVVAALSGRGFEAKALSGVNAAEIAAASGSDLKAKVSGQAEVVITGVITSEFMSQMCDDCPVFFKASGSLRAVDTRTGQVVAEINEPGKKMVGTNPTAAGTKALEESAKTAVPAIVDALAKALQR